MQREIKFRAWNKREQVMLYRNLTDRNWYYTPANDDEGCHTAYSAKPEDRINFHIMQFTGLKDKNGIDIHEDDLIKLKDVFGRNVIGLVIWNSVGNVGWSVKYEDETGCYTMHLISSTEYEILGNIHQHVIEDFK